MLTTKITVDEFDRIVELPENADKLFEYIGGEIVEAPSNPYASYIGGRILRRVAAFVEDHDLGFTTGEAGGYIVSGEKYAPDVGYSRNTRDPPRSYSGCISLLWGILYRRFADCANGFCAKEEGIGDVRRTFIVAARKQLHICWACVKNGREFDTAYHERGQDRGNTGR